jgi:hypothetical protein
MSNVSESQGFDPADLAALAWQVELGADEAIGEAPVNRFEVAEVQAPAAKPVAAVAERAPDGESEAAELARGRARWPSCARRWRGSRAAR